MNRQRREFVQTLAVGGGVCAAAALGLGSSLEVQAAGGESAFKQDKVESLLEQLGAKGAPASQEISLETPAVASNGSMVPVVAHSRIPGTDYMALIADQNPFPLLAEYDILEGADAYVSTRIKMRKTSQVRVVVRAKGQYYMLGNEVKVTIGGCGG